MRAWLRFKKSRVKRLSKQLEQQPRLPKKKSFQVAPAEGQVLQAWDANIHALIEAFSKAQALQMALRERDHRQALVEVLQGQSLL